MGRAGYGRPKIGCPLAGVRVRVPPPAFAEASSFTGRGPATVYEKMAAESLPGGNTLSREEIAASARRPTPLDPYPEPRPSVEGGDEKAFPPELGTDAIAVLEGRTFLLSDALGDVPAGSVGGLVHD